MRCVQQLLLFNQVWQAAPPPTQWLGDPWDPWAALDAHLQ